MDVKTFSGTDDLSDALLVRDLVFTREQGFQNPDSDEFDTVSLHVVVYDAQNPVATGRCYSDPDEPQIWHIGRICVLADYRGRDLGRVIMEQLETLARREGAKTLVLGAQVYAVPFYQKCGFQPTGKRYMDEFCEHEMMEKNC